MDEPRVLAGAEPAPIALEVRGRPPADHGLARPSI